MKNNFKLLIIFLFICNCSLDTKSGFWSKTEKINEKDNSKIKKFFVEKNILEKEFNTKIKINLKQNNLSNNFTDNNTNNNGNVNFTGSLKKKSKYKFKKINNFINIRPELLFTKDKSFVFFDNKGAIIKFDENSNLEWKTNIYNKKEIKLNPILSFSNNEEFLLVVDNLGKYYSINLNNGNLIWSKKNIAPFNSQIKILKDKFYAIDYNNILRCFSVKNGTELWNFESEKTLIKSLERLSIVISNNLVIFQNSLGDLLAVDNNTGNLIWQSPTEKNIMNQNIFTIKNSDLVLHKNSIYFSNNENSFYSIDSKNGIINWKQNINSHLRPTIIEGLVFTITLEGYLVVVDSRNGNILRITNIFDQIKSTKRKNVTPVGFIIASNKIYLSLEDGRMILIDVLNGKSVDIIKITNSKISRPQIVDNQMYLIKDDAVIKVN